MIASSSGARKHFVAKRAHARFSWKTITYIVIKFRSKIISGHLNPRKTVREFINVRVGHRETGIS